MWKMEEDGHLQEQNCSLVRTAEGHSLSAEVRLYMRVLELYRMEKRRLRGWKIPSAGYLPGSQVWCVDLLSSRFHRCAQSSQLSCSELLSPPEALRSLTLQFSHRLSDRKGCKFIISRF